MSLGREIINYYHDATDSDSAEVGNELKRSNSSDFEGPFKFVLSA